MKKLLVLMLVLGMASLANAALLTTPYVNGIVTWSVSGGQLIGTGTSLGTFNGYISQETFITPDTTTDGADDGLMAAAGNAGGVDSLGGVVWAVNAEMVSTPDPQQVVGEWFRFDITGEGDVTLYATNQDVIGQMHVPEPMTMILLGVGGLFLRRRKA